MLLSRGGFEAKCSLQLFFCCYKLMSCLRSTTSSSTFDSPRPGACESIDLSLSSFCMMQTGPPLVVIVDHPVVVSMIPQIHLVPINDQANDIKPKLLGLNRPKPKPTRPQIETPLIDFYPRTIACETMTII